MAQAPAEDLKRTALGLLDDTPRRLRSWSAMLRATKGAELEQAAIALGTALFGEPPGWGCHGQVKVDGNDAASAILTA